MRFYFIGGKAEHDDIVLGEMESAPNMDAAVQMAVKRTRADAIARVNFDGITFTNGRYVRVANTQCEMALINSLPRLANGN